MQVLNIFGDGKNCQSQTFKWLYQVNESKYEKSFLGKILTVMLFPMYQVFSSLLDHLHFSLHFFSTFMEQLFLNHPISVNHHSKEKKKNHVHLLMKFIINIRRTIIHYATTWYQCPTCSSNVNDRETLHYCSHDCA